MPLLKSGEWKENTSFSAGFKLPSGLVASQARPALRDAARAVKSEEKEMETVLKLRGPGVAPGVGGPGQLPQVGGPKLPSGGF